MDSTDYDVKYPKVTAEILGEDGNSFIILSIADNALRQAGVNKSARDDFQSQATSGDYDHLLATVMKWVNVE